MTREKRLERRRERDVGYERIKAKAELRERYAAPPPKPLPLNIIAIPETILKTRVDAPPAEPCDDGWIEHVRSKRLPVKPQPEPISFYRLPQWEILRRNTLRKYGLKCMRCGITDVKMHVDHIKPRSRYPHLSLDPDNLQVLCEPCNSWKSNVYIKDFRPGKARSSNRKPRKRRFPCGKARGVPRV